MVDSGLESEFVNLKSTARSLDESTCWTKGIEDDVYGADYKKNAFVSDGIQKTPDAMAVSSLAGSEAGVYPCLRHFTSLDVSSMDADAYKLLNEFCVSFESLDSFEKYVFNGFMFCFALFKYDYDIMYPNTVLYDHVVGEPFVADSFYQCPVRFFYKKEKEPERDEFSFDVRFVDVYIYVAKKENSWKVFDIEFMKVNGDEN